MRDLMAVVGRRTFGYDKALAETGTLKLRYYRLVERQETGSRHHGRCSLRHRSLRPSFLA